MRRGKKQQFCDGAIVKIRLSDRQFVFGRLFPGFHIGIYDWVISEETDSINLESIVNRDIFLYARIFKHVIEANSFEVIGIKQLTLDEITKIPPHFSQDPINIEKCIIYYIDGSERIATPQECIGLEGAIIWDETSLTARIEMYYQGVKNPYVELHKVIISKEDPRYLTPPHLLRWDNVSKKFLRLDI